MTHPGPTPHRPVVSDRGASLSAFVAIVVVALLAMGGLVIDGGAQSTATRECQQTASEAARAATDAGALHRAAGLPSDAEVVRRAAQTVVARHPGMTGTVTVTNDRVRVVTSKTAETTFLGLIGITRLSASGAAESSLRSS